jgi:hypothetical protein
MMPYLSAPVRILQGNALFIQDGGTDEVILSWIITNTSINGRK